MRARGVVCAAAAIGAAMVVVGLVAQVRTAAPPRWARFVDGSMAWAVTPDRVGPLRVVSFTLTPASPEGVRYAMLENAGAHQWPTATRTGVALSRGGVLALRESTGGRAFTGRAPAWTLWGPGAALLGAPMVDGLRRRRARRRGRCSRCAYDRRGLPDGAPCPECGAG